MPRKNDLSAMIDCLEGYSYYDDPVPTFVRIDPPVTLAISTPRRPPEHFHPYAANPKRQTKHISPKKDSLVKEAIVKDPVIEDPIVENTFIKDVTLVDWPSDSNPPLTFSSNDFVLSDDAFLPEDPFLLDTFPKYDPFDPECFTTSDLLSFDLGLVPPLDSSTSTDSCLTEPQAFRLPDALSSAEPLSANATNASSPSVKSLNPSALDIKPSPLLVDTAKSFSLDFMDDPSLFEYTAAYDDYIYLSPTEPICSSETPVPVLTDDERDPPQVFFVGGYNQVLPAENTNGKRALPPYQRPKTPMEIAPYPPPDLSELTVAQLKMELKKFNASGVGKKEVLIGRLNGLLGR